MRRSIAIPGAAILCSLHIGPAAAGWPALGGAGVMVCDTTASPRFPASGSDGSGGAYFVWYDSRDPWTGQFFAQHISGSGDPMWTANGITIGSTEGAQEPPAVVGDGEGGAIVVWRDFRADTAGNVYAQRLDPAGMLLWGPDGVPVNLGARHEVSIVAAADGAGGAFVAWRDDRDSIFTIRVQRLDSSGNRLWHPDGVVAAPSMTSQSSPRLAADGFGGALVAWTDVREGVIHGFAQRLAGTGSAQWAELGVQLSTSTLGTFVDEIAADGTGGMVVAWRDYRSQNTWSQTFAQRVTADGTTAWAPDGVSLSGTTYPVERTMVCSDGSGGAIVGWHDHRMGVDGVLAQRVSATGEKLWTLPAVEVGLGLTSGGWNQVKLLTDGSNGAVFVWNAPWSGDAFSVYAQRLDPLGALMWPPDAVVLAALPDVVYQLGAVADETGGVVASWVDSHGFVGGTSLGAQRVAGGGTLGAPREETTPSALVCVPTPARAHEGVELRFAVSPGSSVELGIYDLGGRLVRSLGSGSPGGVVNRVRWDGRDAGGRLSAPGVYFARARAGGANEWAKVVITE